MSRLARFIAVVIHSAMLMGQQMIRHAQRIRTTPIGVPHLLVTVLVSTVVAALVTILVLTRLTGLGFGTAATYIVANGTTAPAWQLNGSAGPNLNANGAALESRNAANSAYADFQGMGGTFASFTGTAGSGGVNLGSMTGTTFLPTGDLSWTGATSSRLRLHAAGNSIVNTTSGAQMEVEAEGGGLLLIGANTTNNVDICQGSSLASPTCNISIGVSDGFGASILNIFNSGFSAPGTRGDFLQLGPNFSPKVDSTYACGTGGTEVIGANAFGVVVTTGTLTSNCVLNFATNDPTGIFYVDMSGVTLNATFGIVFENGTATQTVLSTSNAGTLATVWTHGANTLAVRW
jgi:hypothetical protein